MNKRIFTTILALAAIMLGAHAISTDTDGYYLISSAQDLKDFATLVNGGETTANAKLTADIELNGTWQGIGTNEYNFNGTFDGQGHTISGFTSGYGLFAYIGSDGTVKRVIADGQISTGGYGGGIAMLNYGLISRCGFIGTVRGGGGTNNDDVAGICGENGGTVEFCYNQGSVIGRYVGGIVGYNLNKGTVRYCYNSGSLSMDYIKYSSAIIGHSYGSASKCYTLSGSANHHGSEGYAGTVMTAEQFASGEVCYLLQQGASGEQIWGQAIGTDAVPQLTDEFGKVVLLKDGNYYNQSIFKYTVSGGEVTITGFADGFTVPENYDLVIPDEIEGKPVTKIGEGAFYNYEENAKNKKIKTVMIGKNVRTIETSAFQWVRMSNLTFAEDSQIESIGSSAFDGGDNWNIVSTIEELVLPASLKTLGNHAFSYNRRLKSITFKGKVSSIGTYTFMACKTLTTINVPLEYLDDYSAMNLSDGSEVYPRSIFKSSYTLPSSGVGTFSTGVAVALPEGLDAYQATTLQVSGSDLAISMTKIEGTLPASTGVVLRGEGGETFTIAASSETPAALTDNTLVAVTEATHVNQTDGDYTNFILTGGKFVKIAASSNPDDKLPANRAYLPLLTASLSSPSPVVALEWGETTGISSPSPTLPKGRVSGLYTIDGRKVSLSPLGETEGALPRGIYVQNGRKVIVK